MNPVSALRLPLLLAPALLGGCVMVTATRSPHLDAAAPCHPRVVRAGLPPDSLWEELGSARAEGSIFMDASDAEPKLAAEACRLGADVVWIQHERYGVPFVGGEVQAVFARRVGPAHPEQAVPPLVEAH